MHRNGETSSTDDQVQPEDRFPTGTGDPADPAAAQADRQPGVTAADVTAGQSGDPLGRGPSPSPSGDVLAAGLAGRPLTAVRDEDADAAADAGPEAALADGAAGTGFRGVPPAEGQWVAGNRGPGQADEPGRPGQQAPAPGGLRPGAGAGAGADADAGAGAPLLSDQAGLRERWLQIQSGFIDDPRASVTDAAGFVSEVTTAIVAAVQERERGLRGAWDGKSDADTEVLRNALREYRAFFGLLTQL